jgi:charged multivesicular body protein 2A
MSHDLLHHSPASYPLSGVKAMASMNRGLNLPAIQKIMNDFERESSMMDMKEEMMSDAVDDVMDDEVEEEEEGDRIVNCVFLSLRKELLAYPSDLQTGNRPCLMWPNFPGYP